MLFQSQSVTPNSHLDIYRRVAAIRKLKSFYGSQHLEFLVVDDNIIAFVRYDPDQNNVPIFLIAMNIGRVKSTGNYIVKLKDKQYITGKVLLELDSKELRQTQSAVVALDEITLAVGQAIILELSAPTQHSIGVCISISMLVCVCMCVLLHARYRTLYFAAAFGFFVLVCFWLSTRATM